MKKGYQHHAWKGSNVKRSALHQWVARCKGKPKKCEHCGTSNLNKKYHWANISGKYKRDIKDFKRLCCKCHRIFDNHLLAKGERNGRSKLNNKQVLKIRQLYVPHEYSQRKLAKNFNVSQPLIMLILKRKSWAHI